MSKIIQVKVPINNNYNWKLVRERDNLTKKSEDVKWISWDKNGRYKSSYEEPAIGRSLLMSPFNDFYTWMTTEVTEILEQKKDYVKFKTNNSIYELFKTNKNKS